MLEELLIGHHSFTAWDVVGTSAGGMNASLTELNSLSHLAVLSLKIPKVERIPRDFVFPSLLKYDILLGDGLQVPVTIYPTSTVLYLDKTSATSLNAKTFEQLLKRLEHVEVNGCGDIRTLFPAKWRQALKNLRRVEIEDCQSLEEVFELGVADEGINEEKELPLLSSLTRLHLQWLPELKCIWKGPTRHVSLKSLIHLELQSLHKLTFIFTPSLAQSLFHLETLLILSCGELKHIIREEDDEREIISEPLRFPKLKTIFISECGKLEHVFPDCVSPSLGNLEEIMIRDAGNLKQIFYRGKGDALTTDDIINFPQLRKLSLFSISNCSFFAPKNFAAQLPSLQNLRIYGHEELDNLLIQLQGLTSLETLELVYMPLPNMRCIWKGLVLSHLTSLVVYKCKRLTYVFIDNVIASLVQLEVLEISTCDELEQIIAKDNDDEKDQILAGSDLQSSCFPNLCRIEIKECNKLKSLFPIAMALGLKKLQLLEVRESSQLLGVFGQDDHASPVNVEKEMVLPDLQELLLIQLPSIACFSLGCHDFLFRRLETLKVYECPKLTTKFTTTTNGSMSAQSEGFMNLRELYIGNMERVQDLMQVGRLVTNKRGGHELSLVSLQTLHLSLLPDMRCIWEGLVPSNLTTLKVKECRRLTYAFTDNMTASLVQLKVLKISKCEELEQIIAKDDDEKDRILSRSDLQSLCFPNLCQLKIKRCNKLKSLFPIAMASGLPKLQILEIRESSQLLGVFGQDDHASPVNVEKEMVLPNLQELSLQQLQSIACFIPGCYDFLFPRLEKLEMRQCPKLITTHATTSNGSMGAESEVFINSKEIYIRNCEGVQDLMQVGSLVTNIRGGHELSLLSLEKLHLNLLPDMRCIWKGLVPSILTTLVVNECKRLTHIFTDSMIATLVQLNYLKISNCEELEQIIAKDIDDEKNKILLGRCHQSLCFPNSCSNEIIEENKLKSHASPVDVEKEMVLHNLQWLFLEKLPSIVCFSHGCYDFLFPHLWMLEVRQCPKLTTKFATTSNGSMSAQSEVSQVAEDSSTGCSVPTNICRMWTRNNGWEEKEEEEKGDDGGLIINSFR